MASDSHVFRKTDLEGESNKIGAFLDASGKYNQKVVLATSEGVELTEVPVTSVEREDANITFTLTYTVDDDATDWKSLNGKPLMGLLIPVVNGTPDITVEVSIDGGTTPITLKDNDGSGDPITITAGATAFAVGSDWLTPLAGYAGENCDIRFVFSVAQTADRIITALSQP